MKISQRLVGETVSGSADGYASIYAALDHLWIARGLPSDRMGRLARAIEDLRATVAPRADVELAEDIAVTFHKIEWARRNRDPGAECTARSFLDCLGKAWMHRRVGGQMAKAGHA